jgi:hypothetical protein
MGKTNPKLHQLTKIFLYVNAIATIAFWGCANITFLRACTFCISWGLQLTVLISDIISSPGYCLSILNLCYFNHTFRSWPYVSNSVTLLSCVSFTDDDSNIPRKQRQYRRMTQFRIGGESVSPYRYFPFFTIYLSHMFHIASSSSSSSSLSSPSPPSHETRGWSPENTRECFATLVRRLS